MRKKSQPLFVEKSGRISIEARAMPQGQDLLVSVTGGQAHIGAVAIAWGAGQHVCFPRPGHREDQLAVEMAGRIAAALNCAVTVCAGMHFPAISPAEIRRVFELCDMLAEKIIGFYHEQK